MPDAAPGFDTPPSFQGTVPVVTLNGIDEDADTPDADYWSAGADGTGGKEPTLSVGAWLHVPNTAVACAILAKSLTEAMGQWTLQVLADDTLRFHTWDASAGVTARRITDSTITMGQWIFVVVTCGGIGGAAAANGMTIYIDGIVAASTAVNSGSYIAMENQSGVVELAQVENGSSFNGKTAGGPCGPFFT